MKLNRHSNQTYKLRSKSLLPEISVHRPHVPSSHKTQTTPDQVNSRLYLNLQSFKRKLKPLISRLQRPNLTLNEDEQPRLTRFVFKRNPACLQTISTSNIHIHSQRQQRTLLQKMRNTEIHRKQPIIEEISDISRIDEQVQDEQELKELINLPKHFKSKQTLKRGGTSKKFPYDFFK